MKMIFRVTKPNRPSFNPKLMAVYNRGKNSSFTSTREDQISIDKKRILRMT